MIHDIEQRYQIKHTSEVPSSKIEIDHKTPYNNIIQSSEDIFIQNDKIIIQHPKRIQKQDRLPKPPLPTIKQQENNTNRRKPPTIPDQKSATLTCNPISQKPSINLYIRRITPKDKNLISGPTNHDGQTQKIMETTTKKRKRFQNKASKQYDT